MATTLGIANQALIRVGAEPITQSHFDNDSNERARAVSDSWDFVRREVLRSHSWNVATTRTFLKSYAPEPLWGFDAAYTLPPDCLRVLEVDTYEVWRIESDRILTDGTPSPTLEAAVSLSAAPWVTNPVNVVANTHGYATGDIVKLDGTTMTEVNGRFFQITVFDPNNFSLDNENGLGRSAPLVVQGTAQRVSEGDLKVRYIKDLTSGLDGIFDPDLESLLSLRLAIEIVERVTDSTTKRTALEAEYSVMIGEAKMNDGEEQSNTEFEESSWITARY